MENQEEQRACLCALNRIFGFEPRIGKALIETFGSATEVFRQSGKTLQEALGEYSRTKYAPMISTGAFESAAMELEGLQASGCRFVGIGEEGYPKLLMECEDPPLGLYYKGALPPEEVLGRHPQIAIVGTRNITSYGRDWCRLIVEAMSKAKVKPLIVSGLALGVDVTAHRAALDCGLPTVGVMATGIDLLYPSRNAPVGEEMASRSGCALVTDYPPGTGALRINFLRRNRIIAGMCSATILVESKIKGGGMMTARLASSYDREVYALPGRVDDPFSQGCNLLIRETQAEPIGDVAQLAAKLGLGRADISLKKDFEAEVALFYSSLPPSALEEILHVALTIKRFRGISVDELCSRLHLSYSQASRLVTTLECDGFVSVDLLGHCSARMSKA